MSRSPFTRLGEHIARDTAREIRERATAHPNDIEANLALKTLEAASSPAAVREKIRTIVRNHLKDADATLAETLPLATAGMTGGQYGARLSEWANETAPTYIFDSPEGRSIEIVRLCAHILEGMSLGQPDFDLGVVLGYGLAQKNHLLVREFADGPALARERANAHGRALGGSTRSIALRANVQARDRKICTEFANRQNKALSKQRWAQANEKRLDSAYGLKPGSVRKILAER
jgi:hypothetical protein